MVFRLAKQNWRQHDHQSEKEIFHGVSNVVETGGGRGRTEVAGCGGGETAACGGRGARRGWRMPAGGVGDEAARRCGPTTFASSCNFFPKKAKSYNLCQGFIVLYYVQSVGTQLPLWLPFDSVVHSREMLQKINNSRCENVSSVPVELQIGHIQ